MEFYFHEGPYTLIMHEAFPPGGESIITSISVYDERAKRIVGVFTK